MTRVLLSTVCRPFGGPGEGNSVGAELFNAQVTRAQGLFSFRQVIRCWAIDYIAENIAVPTVAMHYPSEREFIRELKAHQYDYVGINFVVATFHKVRRMVPLIRKHAPHAKVILGGYGTVLPDELLAPFSDHICREEGIGFMRRLLDEPADQPVSHPYAPIPAVRVFSYQPPNVVGHLTAGLGCPNGCDFCCTSHFFKREYVPFLKTGKDIYDELRSMQRRAEERGDDLRGFIFIDEDFFLFKQRARDFLDCVREGGKPLSLMGFGSIRGLSQFTADEIAEMGFDTIWTGFEGVESGYGKLKGRPTEEIYSSLKARGVSILSSMIIGFPYQDREQILQEFGRLMRLSPAMTQILIYFAFPGTPFHSQVLAEDRYLPEYQKSPDLRRWDGFAMHFKHPNFTASELEALQKELFQREFETLGPSIVRMVQAWFDGYRNLRDSSVPLLRARAERLWTGILEARPTLIPAMLLGPTRETRAMAKRLHREIGKETKSIPLSIRLQGAGLLALAAWTWLSRNTGFLQQPALLRIEHRMKHDTQPAVPVSRLQGGFHANLAYALTEDLAHKAAILFRRFFPKRDGFSASVITQRVASAGRELIQVSIQKPQTE
ncbi:MAG: B12-binding domain-containing radical SAM protein [Planctomycetota bacterium]